MRELKFRAYIDENGQKNFVFIDLNNSNTDELARFHVLTNKFGVIKEQYTGLKDKNGKEIYEGDILGGIWEDGYIAYCDKCKQFQYHCNGVGCMACSGDVQWYELVDDKELEVIGNIHENPELLEQGNAKD